VDRSGQYPQRGGDERGSDSRAVGKGLSVDIVLVPNLSARDIEMTALTNKSVKSMGTAEAFYRVFCALPISARLAVARYIIEDEEIQHLLENPNETTLEAFAENKSSMPVFHTVDELRKDLLM
jgi:hypothetical protein